MLKTLPTWSDTATYEISSQAEGHCTALHPQCKCSLSCCSSGLSGP